MLALALAGTLSARAQTVKSGLGSPSHPTTIHYSLFGWDEDGREVIGWDEDGWCTRRTDSTIDFSKCGVILGAKTGGKMQEVSGNVLTLTPDETPEPLIVVDQKQTGELMVSIASDGKLTYGPNYKPDEAAKLFWETVAQMRASPPCQAAK